MCRQRYKKNVSHTEESDTVESNLTQNVSPLSLSTFEPSLKPIASKVKLKDIVGEFDVATFCPISSIISLLNDPSTNTINKTLYNQELYLNPVANESKTYNDIHTSQWFRNAHKQLISQSDCNKVLLCPLLFFIDGTAIGAYSNKSLEPVSFTLCIFNRETRNVHES